MADQIKINNPIKTAATKEAQALAKATERSRQQNKPKLLPMQSIIQLDKIELRNQFLGLNISFGFKYQFLGLNINRFLGLNINSDKKHFQTNADQFGEQIY